MSDERHFTPAEQDIVRHLLPAMSQDHATIQEVLKSFFFTERQGRGLVVHTTGAYAVLFLNKDIYDDESQREKEVRAFMALLTLLNYLSKRGYINIYKYKLDEFYLIQDGFDVCKRANNEIILNAKGYRSSNIETVLDADKNIVYRGVVFSGDNYNLIADVVFGSLYVTPQLSSLSAQDHTISADHPPSSVRGQASNPSKLALASWSSTTMPLHLDFGTSGSGTLPTVAADVHLQQPSMKQSPPFIDPPNIQQRNISSTPSTQQTNAQELKPEDTSTASVTSAPPAMTTSELRHKLRFVFAYVCLTLLLVLALLVGGGFHERLTKLESQMHVFSAHDVSNSGGGAEVVDSAQTALLYGIDVSRWNGNVKQDLIRNKNLSFVIARASFGEKGVDSNFRDNWGVANSKGLMVGAYHFLRVDKDPVAQAENFVKAMGTVGEIDISPVVDIEQASLPTNAKYAAFQVQSALMSFIIYLEKKTNKKPMIYTDLAFADQYLQNKYFSTYPLWLAEYSGDSSPKLPITWKDTGFKIWQRKNNYSINSNDLDLDVFYGSKQEMMKTN